MVAGGRTAGPWTATTGDKVYSSPLVDGGVVYIGSNDGNLYAFDAATGAQRWRYPTQGSVTSSPRIAEGTLFRTRTGELSVGEPFHLHPRRQLQHRILLGRGEVVVAQEVPRSARYGRHRGFREERRGTPLPAPR